MKLKVREKNNYDVILRAPYFYGAFFNIYFELY